MVMQLDEKILGAEDVAVFGGTFGGFGDIIGLQGGVYFAGQTAAQTDQALGVGGEKFLVYARAIMKSVEVRGGNELNQVSVAHLITRQQREMKSGRTRRGGAVLMRTGGNVSLASDDRFDSCPL